MQFARKGPLAVRTVNERSMQHQAVPNSPRSYVHVVSCQPYYSAYLHLASSLAGRDWSVLKKAMNGVPSLKIPSERSATGNRSKGGLTEWLWVRFS